MNIPIPSVLEQPIPQSNNLNVDRAKWLAQLAVNALLAEVQLTPKPALVDKRGSGAHKDLTLETMQRSAYSLYPTFLQMALCAEGRRAERSLREDLAAIGRSGEIVMLTATGGSNAHRGAIWTIGLLLAAASMLPERGFRDIATLAGKISRFKDRCVSKPRSSNGQNVAIKYGVSGARGEAGNGFPTIVDIGLPALQAARAQGLSETCARLDCLMYIMAKLEDTCLLHRGGLDGLHTAQQGAALVMQAGGSSTKKGMQALSSLHEKLMALNASPGGAADMLAGTIFLDWVDSRMNITNN